VLLGMVLAGRVPADAAEFLARVGGLDVPAGTVVHGDAIALRGTVSVEGTVVGDVVALGGNAVVVGRVGGSVRAIGGDVVLGATAVVGGTATAQGGRVTAAPGASIGRPGAVPAPPPSVPAPPLPAPGAPPAPWPPPALWFPMALAIIAALKALIWLFVLVTVLSFIGTTWLTAVLFPRISGRLAGLLERTPAAAFGVGLVGWAALGVLGTVLVMSIVGVPVVVLLLLVVLTALQFGVTAIAVLFGRHLRPSGVGLEALVGAVVLAVVFAIPHLGGLLVLLAGTWGIGVVLLAFLERSRAWPAPPVSPPVAPGPP